ncbi:nuclear transport factor 2 family protein [Paenibacillus glycinis]|uniref:Nuclear transport factor 2 family protein n=1 Tax=Paenibacillus glycinis TaxID=2697035 RepID=A0ABW9XQ79_9BACL|nr:nuclear transport factor 2 family protein [Paenibacillus glycinis]NBD24793.1 nuclear transport factor 2 family protein [Paenibacillus glycinis]
MIALPASVKAYFDAANADRRDAFLAAFDENAFVFDDNRTFQGTEAIRNWSDADVFGARVRFSVIDATEQDGAYAVIASVDGDFDKTNLPDPFLLRHAFELSGGKIKALRVTLP